MDELWRALRGAPGLVEPADALTRLSRTPAWPDHVTHSLDDLDALPTEDRAKARGLAERCAIKVLAGLPGRELDRISQIARLSGPEREWSPPGPRRSPRARRRHPGRGKYLIKTGNAPACPSQLSLVGDELALYDTGPGHSR